MWTTAWRTRRCAWAVPWGSDPERTTCGSLDNVQNYMEYSYCSRMYTLGQRARMRAALNSSTADRNQLWTPQNLEETGVFEEELLCKAEFTVDRVEVCLGKRSNSQTRASSV